MADFFLANFKKVCKTKGGKKPPKNLWSHREYTILKATRTHFLQSVIRSSHFLLQVTNYGSISVFNFPNRDWLEFRYFVVKQVFAKRIQVGLQYKLRNTQSRFGWHRMKDKEDATKQGIEGQKTKPTEKSLAW